MAGVTHRAIGIDFGTSTSLLAERAGTRPVGIVPLGRGTRWLPSLAGLDNERLLVGEDAEKLPVAQIIRSVKRAISNGDDLVEVSDGSRSHQINADQVIVALLEELVRRAEAEGQSLGVHEEVRLGCPAMWDGAQRRRLQSLGVRAGLPVAQSALIDEPIAAGVAWVTHRYLARRERPEGRLLVFDMGGGTLDIAVLDVVGGPRPEISVLSALGAQLAGDMLDQAIARDLTEELAGKGFDLASLAEAKTAEALVLREARDAKFRLSAQAQHRIVFRGLASARLPIITYSRERLEESFRPQMDRAVELIWAALRAAKLTELGNRAPDALRRMGAAELAGEIDYVLLTGGMSRVPYVEQRIGELFPEALVYDDAGSAPEEAIVAGLADTAGYDRLNLHRPGFDFVLEYSEGAQRRTKIIYPAYTPFYSPADAFTMSLLGFERRGADFPGPRHGEGVLRVRAVSGQYLRLRYESELKDGLKLRLGEGMLFKIYCDGRIVIHDGIGQTRAMRVDQWPVVRGNDHAELVLQRVNDAPPVLPTAWYLEKEYAPPGI